MQKYLATPREMFASTWRNKALIKNLVRREVIGRYSGSMLGTLWSFLNPIFMLAVYTFVFSYVFKARWSSSPNESKAEFALVLFSGLIIFNIFAECFNRAPTLILSNSNYVKKVVFPLEVLPIVSIGAALFHTIISVLVWLLFYVIAIGEPHLTVLLFPLILLPITVLMTGLGWIVSALSVYLRDMNQLANIITTVLMFLSPIFFPIEALPEKFRPVLGLNPLSPGIAMMRDVLFWGRVPSITSYLTYLTGVSVFAWFGFVFFQKTRKGFADVL